MTPPPQPSKMASGNAAMQCTPPEMFGNVVGDVPDSLRGRNPMSEMSEEVSDAFDSPPELEAAAGEEHKAKGKNGLDSSGGGETVLGDTGPERGETGVSLSTAGEETLRSLSPAGELRLSAPASRPKARRVLDLQDLRRGCCRSSPQNRTVPSVLLALTVHELVALSRHPILPSLPCFSVRVRWVVLAERTRRSPLAQPSHTSVELCAMHRGPAPSWFSKTTRVMTDSTGCCCVGCCSTERAPSFSRQCTHTSNEGRLVGSCCHISANNARIHGGT